MHLTRRIKITNEYSGNSKYTFWNKLKAGDEIIISHVLSPTRSKPCGGNYAPMYTAEVVKGNSKWNCFTGTINNFCNYLAKIGYDIVPEEGDPDQ